MDRFQVAKVSLAKLWKFKVFGESNFPFDIPFFWKARQEMVEITSSDDEEEETEPEGAPSETSDARERNFNLPTPPYSQEESPPRRRGRFTLLRSPNPPGYVPLTFFQNMYSPPIRLRSEEDYHRRELIGMYNRDRMDLYYKYEFQAQQLKRARRQYHWMLLLITERNTLITYYHFTCTLLLSVFYKRTWGMVYLYFVLTLPNKKHIQPLRVAALKKLTL